MEVGILDVLRVDLCARALLDYVPAVDLLRSERVCTRWQAAVHQYLSESRALNFRAFRKSYCEQFYCIQDKSKPLTIAVHYAHPSLPTLCKIMSKWGSYIVKVFIELGEDTHLDSLISECPWLDEKYYPVIHGLPSLTDLEHGETGFLDIGIPLKEMPQLEDLDLSFINDTVSLGAESIEALTSLVNLKSLVMNRSCSGVNDAFLEALARGCKKLEFLKILERESTVTARGVIALCRRSPSAVTTIDFSCFKHSRDDDLESMFDCFGNAALYQELAALGFFELTPEWFKAAARNPLGYRLVVDPEPEGSAPQTGDTNKELKMLICSMPMC